MITDRIKNLWIVIEVAKEIIKLNIVSVSGELSSKLKSPIVFVYFIL